MNIEREYTAELAAIQNLVSAAKQQYDDRDRTPESVPADYRVLFVLFKDVTMANVQYAVTSNEEAVFDAAVINFKNTVENFAYHNVHMICDVQKVNDALTFDSQGMITITDVIGYYDRFAPTGSYDAVFTVTKSCGVVGETDRLMFNILRYYGYSHCVIRSEDLNHTLPANPDTSTPYLVTTNTFIHEWLHQLEAFRNYFLEDGFIMYPYTHTYLPDWGNGETDPKLIRANYSWDTTYFNDTTAFPDVVERSLTSYYRAVLACEVTYIPDNNRPLGMYPKLWKVTPHKIVLGRYLIQNASGQYYYYDVNTPSSPYKLSSTYSHDPKFQFDIRYAFSTKNFHAGSAMVLSSIMLNYTPSTCTLTRIGPYFLGKYYFINESLNYTLGYTVNNSTYAFALTIYHDSTPKFFKLSHNANAFYYISPSTASNRYWDLTNNNNTENNIINLHTKTNYLTAQTWQIRYGSLPRYSVLPLRTSTRAAAYYNSNLRICSVGGSNSQQWRLEQVDNGKFIYDGVYYIRTSAGYIGYSGNSLIISNTPTAWSIQFIEDNYYRISITIGNTVKYFDVHNNQNYEGNTIELHTLTSYTDAQLWKFMLQNDGSVLIVPRLSLTRGMKNNTTSMVLSVNPTSWYLEKVVSNS